MQGFCEDQSSKRQEELGCWACWSNLSLTLGVHTLFGAHMEVQPEEATVASLGCR